MKVIGASNKDTNNGHGTYGNSNNSDSNNNNVTNDFVFCGNCSNYKSAMSGLCDL